MHSKMLKKQNFTVIGLKRSIKKKERKKKQNVFTFTCQNNKLKQSCKQIKQKIRNTRVI